MLRVLPVLGVFLTLVMLSKPAPVSAAGWTASIKPVASTHIDTSRGTPLMLCKMLPTWRVWGLPLWPGDPRYALAVTCSGGDRLSPISPDRVAAAQSAGLVPDGIAPHPQLALPDWLAGLWGWSFFAMLGMTLFLMQRRRRRVERFASLGT